jgi:tetratricopeptide (TPR) repeat protein
VFLVGAAIGSALTLGAAKTFTLSAPPPRLSPNQLNPLSLTELLATHPEQLQKVDLAAMNLACAFRLPGADELLAEAKLAILDEWTARVKRETERHLYRLNDPRYSAHYKNSEALYRMEMLCQVLQEDCGVRYNLDRVRDVRFSDARDLFIHGMIGDSNGGTCVSMPVLYTAVARRLGYPVHLVRAKGHIFCRWDGRGERWNIEATGSGGMDSFPDKHYMTWPEAITQDEVKRGEYLKTLDPSEEFAVFLAARGHCLQDNGRFAEAHVAYAYAHKLDPTARDYLGFLLESVKKGAHSDEARPTTRPH